MAGPRQFFVQKEDALNDLIDDLLVFDTQRNSNLFLSDNPDYRKMTHKEYTDVCALRLGVARVANTHFSRGGQHIPGVKCINNYQPVR